MVNSGLRKMVLSACCAGAVLTAAPSAARAECALVEWLFGRGQTTYAPPYCPPNVYAPAAGAPNCAPAQCAPVCQPCAPVCQPCVPSTTYRINYRPVPTVAYMPVTAVDPCTGCAVTTYRPTRAWTYHASLVPYSTYRVGYAPAAMAGCAPACGSYPSCSPCGGYSSWGGCGVPSSGRAVSSGCSSCGVSATPLPGPADMSRPPLASPSTVVPGSPATIGPPGTPPATSGGEVPKTYAPGSSAAPVAPGAPGSAAPAAPSSDSRYYRGSSLNEGSRSVEPLKIQGVPPVLDGPRLSPAPADRPASPNLTTSRPVYRAGYFQVLPSPPATVPVRTISSPATSALLPVDDGGWRHVER